MIHRCTEGSTVTVDTQFIFNKKLSAEARVILLIALTHSDDHRFYIDELINESGLSKYKVDKALKELKANKYIQYKHVMTPSGRFDGVEWIITENPYGKPSHKRNAVNDISEQPQVISASEYNFNRIWEAYPAHRRGDRKEAMKAYKQISDADVIIEDILNGLREMQGKEDWKKDEGRWIPGLKKFLANRIWEEGLENPTSAQGYKEKMMEVLRNAGY